MTILFFILFFLIFGKLFKFAMKATWSVMKAVVFIMVMPLMLMGMVLGGMVYIALPILLLVGFVSLLRSATVS